MEVIEVEINQLKPSEYNPRAMTEDEATHLRRSLEDFGMVEPIVVNSATGRKNIIIGGHQRYYLLKEMNRKTIPIVYVNIPDLNKERELNLRLNKNLGHWDYDLLANFDEEELTDVGFSSDELDSVFGLKVDEGFDVEEDVKKILEKGAKRVKEGDIWQLGDHKLIIGNCVKRETWERLLGEERFDFMFTDPPYKLDYTQKRFKGHVKTKQGFGYRQQRKYLGVERAGGVPEYDEWLKIAKDYQSSVGANVMVFENWRNVVPLWEAIEKYWKIRNMVIWWLPNRHQGFSTPYRFFNKYDIAPLASEGEAAQNEEMEQEFEKFLQEKGSKLIEQHEIAIYAKEGDSDWYGKRTKEEKRSKGYYKSVKGTKWAKISDHITWTASSRASSGQNVVFGTKPIEILVPYIKILSPRHGIVVDPFGGSGSTVIACEVMKRKARLMEIEPVYAEIILMRWEKYAEKEAKKVGSVELSKGDENGQTEQTEQ